MTREAAARQAIDAVAADLYTSSGQRLNDLVTLGQYVRLHVDRVQAEMQADPHRMLPRAGPRAP
jgi:hypothetical protein